MGFQARMYVKSHVTSTQAKLFWPSNDITPNTAVAMVTTAWLSLPWTIVILQDLSFSRAHACEFNSKNNGVHHPASSGPSGMTLISAIHLGMLYHFGFTVYGHRGDSFQRIPLGPLYDDRLTLSLGTNKWSMSISILHLGSREMTTGWVCRRSGHIINKQDPGQSPCFTYSNIPRSDRGTRCWFVSLGINAY